MAVCAHDTYDKNSEKGVNRIQKKKLERKMTWLRIATATRMNTHNSSNKNYSQQQQNRRSNQNSHKQPAPAPAASAPPVATTNNLRRPLSLSPRHVADGVTPSPEYKHRHAEALDVLDSLRVPLEREVETAQAVACQRVRPALQHHRRRLVHFHHLKQIDATQNTVWSRVWGF